MCGVTGVLMANQERSQNDLRMIAELFTELLVGSEHRGPYATGVALINASGDYYISKAPVPASGFVTSRDCRLVIDKLASDTTCLMGHTRWPTRGSHLDNANNHPLVSGGEHQTQGIGLTRSVCILTHNGHVTNHHALSRLMNLKRDAEVDSEIILRLAERNVVESGIAPVSFAEDVSRCRGRLSAIAVATSDPAKILLIKGNQPLEGRYHAARGLIAYASEQGILYSAIGSDSGWEVIEIPAWRIVVVDTRRMMPLTTYPIPRRSNDEDGTMPPCR
jgi:glucosamine 6-phosphate synthetase-like amidotransferase/phosphosugar isomerase protein